MTIIINGIDASQATSRHDEHPDHPSKMGIMIQ
jgi:hypothetical protein